jgi:hypothetical protein
MASAALHTSVPLVYVETTIPAGMTIAEYRASRPRPMRPMRRKRRWWRSRNA